MCIHEYYRSSACGHHFPKLPPSPRSDIFFTDVHGTIDVPQSLTCAPVKLALKFYHDQVVYLPADMNCGAKVEIPRSCPIVHDEPTRRTREAIDGQMIADLELTNAMLRNGLGRAQAMQIEMEALHLDQCSNRAKPGEHSAIDLRRHKQTEYPLNMYAHVQSVKAYQSRAKSLMMPNVRYFLVDFGCGGPFSDQCLTGWSEEGLLTHRLHLWSDFNTHLKPCNDQCLAGWSGDELQDYRQQTWAGNGTRDWSSINYAKFAPEHVLRRTDRWAVLNYGHVKHLHPEQWVWNGIEFARISVLKNGQVVHVPEEVAVPVPNRLRPFLPGLELVEHADQSTIDDIYNQMPRACNEMEPQMGESSQLLVAPADNSMEEPAQEQEPRQEQDPVQQEEPMEEEDPVQQEDPIEEQDPIGEQEPIQEQEPTTEQDPTEEEEPAQEQEPVLEQEPVQKHEPAQQQEPAPAPVETPETAEARRQRARRELRERIATAEARGQRARRELREKIARDFPKGKGKAEIVVGQEG